METLKTLWPVLQPILAGQLRHLLTVAAGMLIAKGALQSEQSGAFVQIGLGLASWVVAAGWSWWQKDGQAKVVAQLAKLKTTTPTVAKVLLVAFALSAFLAGNPAMAQVKLTGNPAKDFAAATGKTITGAPVTDLQNFLNAKFLPDLQYALKLAQASKNTITSDCYQAWIDIITTQQTAVKNADGTDAVMPDPHVITEFEKLVELRNALQPESPFMVKCSPVASMVKLDIAKFMGLVISGGAGLAALVPGL